MLRSLMDGSRGWSTLSEYYWRAFGDKEFMSLFVEEHIIVVSC